MCLSMARTSTAWRRPWQPMCTWRRCLGMHMPPAARCRSRQLAHNQQAEIVALDEAVQGFTRRRFLDLGLTPGTPIYPELHNFFGDPRAYRVRGTLIALRQGSGGEDLGEAAVRRAFTAENAEHTEKTDHRYRSEKLCDLSDALVE